MGNYVSNQVDNIEEKWSEFISMDGMDTSENLNAHSQEVVEANASNYLVDNDTDDEWCEVTERSSGLMDTQLQETNIIQDGDRIISFAPGEGIRPRGIFADKDSEFLFFPLV